MARGQKGLAAEQRANEMATQLTRDKFGAVRTAGAAFTGDTEVQEFRQKAVDSALKNELAKVDQELEELKGEIAKPTPITAPTITPDQQQAYRDMLGGSDKEQDKTEKKAKGRVKRVADFTDKNGKALLQSQQQRDQALFDSQITLEKQKFESRNNIKKG